MAKAISMRDKASQNERAFIDALSVRYVKSFDAAKRREQDQAYADAMAKVAAQYPDDLDAITLYADALFILEPRRGRRDVNAPNVKRLHSVLESALAKDKKHPGACHLYVHATESTEAGARRGEREYPARPARSQHLNTCHRKMEEADGGAIRLRPTTGVALRPEGRRRRRLESILAQLHMCSTCVNGRSGAHARSRPGRITQGPTTRCTPR